MGSPDWGLLPDEVVSLIRQREWTNLANLKARLSGQRAFPIRIGLKPPNGRAAMSSLEHFGQFVRQWRACRFSRFVQWKHRNYRELSVQEVPHSVVLHSVADLVFVLGPEAERRCEIWSRNMAPILSVGRHEAQLYLPMVKHIDHVESMSLEDCKLMATLLPQLHGDMGQGQYLRALPLEGLDTEFL